MCCECGAISSGVTRRHIDLRAPGTRLIVNGLLLVLRLGDDGGRLNIGSGQGDLGGGVVTCKAGSSGGLGGGVLIAGGAGTDNGGWVNVTAGEARAGKGGSTQLKTNLYKLIKTTGY